MPWKMDIGNWLKLPSFVFFKCYTVAWCLKITEKVSFNIASEASYVYILSGQKLIKNCQKWSILASFWKPEACGQTVLPDRSVLIGQKLVENANIKKSNATFWVIFKQCESRKKNNLLGTFADSSKCTLMPKIQFELCLSEISFDCKPFFKKSTSSVSSKFANKVYFAFVLVSKWLKM